VEAAEKLKIVSGIQIYLILECEKQNRGNNSKKQRKKFSDVVVVACCA